MRVSRLSLKVGLMVVGSVFVLGMFAGNIAETDMLRRYLSQTGKLISMMIEVLVLGSVGSMLGVLVANDILKLRLKRGDVVYAVLLNAVAGVLAGLFVQLH